MPASTAPSLFRAPFAFVSDLWRHRELLWQFTLRNVALRHKGSHLGLIWSVLNPLLMLALYVSVFGFIFKGKFNTNTPESHMDYGLAMFLSLTLFQLFAEVLGVAPSVIITNPNFVKKVVFPLEILPAANVGASLFHSLLSMGLVLIGVVTVGPGFSWGILWLPVILLPLLLLLLGIAWFVSAIGVFFRDVSQVIGFITIALMYASAVFFPSTILPPAAWAIMRFNPLLLAIEMARGAVMWHQPVNLTHLGYLSLVGFAACVIGHWCFRRISPAFADVL